MTNRATKRLAALSQTRELPLHDPRFHRSYPTVSEMVRENDYLERTAREVLPFNGDIEFTKATLRAKPRRAPRSAESEVI